MGSALGAIGGVVGTVFGGPGGGAVGSAIGGALGSASGASDAAKAQKNAAGASNALQQQYYGNDVNNFQPYLTQGANALGRAGDMAATGFNFNPTEGQLENTPGYQFTMTQGEKGVQNAAAARGLGASGAALKGAASYATGLADNTYQQQFGNALQSYQTNYGNNLSLAGMGQSGANALGNFGTNTVNQMGNNLIGAGQAQAGADMYSTSALNNGYGNYLNYGLTNALTNKINSGGGIYGGAK